MECDLCLEALIAEEMAELGCHHSVHCACYVAVKSDDPCPVSRLCDGGAVMYDDETREQAIERLAAIKYDRPPPVVRSTLPSLVISLPRITAQDVKEEEEREQRNALQLLAERYPAYCPGRVPVYICDGSLASYALSGGQLTIYVDDSVADTIRVGLAPVSVYFGELYVGRRCVFGPPRSAPAHLRGDGWTFIDFDMMVGWHNGLACTLDVPLSTALASAYKRLHGPLIAVYEEAEALAAKQREYAIEALCDRVGKVLPTRRRPIADTQSVAGWYLAYPVGERCSVQCDASKIKLRYSGEHDGLRYSKHPWKRYLDGAIAWVISFTQPRLYVQYADRWEEIDLEHGHVMPATAVQQLTHKGAIVPVSGYTSLLYGYIRVNGKVYY